MKAETSETPPPPYQYRLPTIKTSYKLLLGRLGPLALSPLPFCWKVLVAFAEGFATGFFNSAAYTQASSTFTFAAMASRLGAEVHDLAPSVGTRGSELDLDPAPGVKVWCLGEVLGPAPGDPELLSVCNADSHSARASAEAGPDFPEEAWVPVDTDPGLPETQIEGTVRTGVSEETQVSSV